MGFRLYNKHFKIGVGVNIAAFIILNIWSFFSAKWKFDASEIKFSGLPSFCWGFPFPWNLDTGTGLGFALNVATIAACGFGVGFLFRWLFSGGK